MARTCRGSAMPQLLGMVTPNCIALSLRQWLCRRAARGGAAGVYRLRESPVVAETLRCLRVVGDRGDVVAELRLRKRDAVFHLSGPPARPVPGRPAAARRAGLVCSRRC